MPAALQPPSRPTLTELARRYGDMPARRIRLDRYPADESEVDELWNTERRIYELVDGVLIQKDSLFRDGVIAASIACELSNFVCGKSLGVVAGGSGMMRLAPGLVRVPDASFIRKAQFPGGRVGRDPIPDIHPDLAVEVISPGNTVEEMDEKLCDYFASGTVLVWYVEPDTRSVLVFTDPERANAKRLSVADTLDGGTVLPSFALPVAALFAELDAI